MLQLRCEKGADTKMHKCLVIGDAICRGYYFKIFHEVMNYYSLYNILDSKLLEFSQTYFLVFFYPSFSLYFCKLDRYRI